VASTSLRRQASSSTDSFRARHTERAYYPYQNTLCCLAHAITPHAANGATAHCRCKFCAARRELAGGDSSVTVEDGMALWFCDVGKEFSGEVRK